jgi:hypothetical protein
VRVLPVSKVEAIFASLDAGCSIRETSRSTKAAQRTVARYHHPVASLPDPRRRRRGPGRDGGGPPVDRQPGLPGGCRSPAGPVAKRAHPQLLEQIAEADLVASILGEAECLTFTR